MPHSHPWKNGGQVLGQAMHLGVTREGAKQNNGERGTPEP